MYFDCGIVRKKSLQRRHRLDFVGWGHKSPQGPDETILK
jgi:hypothetical protein